MANPKPRAVQLARLDHLVLTVRDVEATGVFYARVLGMPSVDFRDLDDTLTEVSTHL